jgi:hypothetical protein
MSCSALTTVGTTAELKKISGSAFVGCAALSSIDTSGCTLIGTQAFKSCTALESVDLSSCQTIESEAFYQSGLTSLTYPGTTMNYRAFGWCESLEEVSMPNFTTFNATYEFLNCTSLKRAYIPQLTKISNSTFGGCQALETADFPLCTYVGYEGLMDCPALETVNMPLVKTVSESAFRWDESLTEINFPLCTTVGKEAFRDCTSLSSVTVKEGCKFGRNVFSGISPRPQVNYV